MTASDRDDPAAIAAATCQGWTYALDTVARPAAEHLAAAQEALAALQAADPVHRWASVRHALHASLAAARARLAPQEITVADLVEAVAQLQAAGIVPLTPLQPLPAGPDQRISELRQELEKTRAELSGVREGLEEAEESAEEANDRAETLATELDRARTLRDRFESEARDLRSKTTVTNAGIAAQAATLRRSVTRETHLAVLAMLGTSGPGFEQMPPDELAETVGEAVRRVARESAAVPRMTEELAKAWGRLVDVQNGPPQLRPEDPEELAKAVRTEALRVCTTLGGTREAITNQLGEIAELRGQLRGDAAASELAGVMRSRDAQAETIRELRDRVERQADSIDGLQRERNQLRDRVVELEREATPGAIQLEED